VANLLEDLFTFHGLLRFLIENGYEDVIEKLSWSAVGAFALNVVHELDRQDRIDPGFFYCLRAARPDKAEVINRVAMSWLAEGQAVASLPHRGLGGAPDTTAPRSGAGKNEGERYHPPRPPEKSALKKAAGKKAAPKTTTPKKAPPKVPCFFQAQMDMEILV